MQIKLKPLMASAWADVVSKNKLREPGLAKALDRLKRTDDDKHDESAAALNEIIKLAAQLKKDKSIVSVPTVVKYIAEMSSAAETMLKEVAKALAEAEKAAKAKAEADKKAKAEAARKDDEEDEEDESSPELLTTKLKPLLKLVAKGELMHALVAKSGKQVKVLLSRKPISPARRKMLTEALGGGSTKFYPGHCGLEGGAITFTLKAEVAGLAKLIKPALFEQTGLKLNKIKCRGEDGDHDDEDEAGDDRSLAGAQDDASADDDHRRPPENDARESGPPDKLLNAPLAWMGTREALNAAISDLKQAITQQLAGEGKAFVDEVNANLTKLDRITSKLDRRLADTLADAAQATDPDSRAGELKIAKAILAEYIRYVASEPLIEHLDKNPFGVATNLRPTLTKSLTDLARSIS